MKEGKTANEIQKERIKEIELKATELLQKCSTITLTSINEEGYPRTCIVSKLGSKSFSNIYIETSKRSDKNGKVSHFENNPKASICYSLDGDSVTLIGNIEIVTDIEEKKEFEEFCDKRFFKKGIYDPKHRLLKFQASEATFWIEKKFRTCKYKNKRV